jgi:hypothetical protein
MIESFISDNFVLILIITIILLVALIGYIFTNVVKKK